LDCGLLVKADVVDYSVFDVKVQVQSSRAFFIGQRIKIADIHSNSLPIGGSVMAIVTHIFSSGNICQIEMRFDGKDGVVRQMRPRPERVTLGNSVPAFAVCHNPLNFEDVFIFNITDISKNGLGLKSDFAKVPMLPGCKLDSVQIMVPGFETISISGSVRFVNYRSSHKQFNCGLQVDKSDASAFHEMLAMSLLLHGTSNDASIAHIRAAGITCKSVRRLVTWRQAQSKSEYEHVCRQRYEAYVLDGKLDGSCGADFVKEQYDKHSVIIYAEHRGQIIGSVRATACRRPGEKFEIEEAGPLPSYLSRERTIEISRLCVCGEWRGTDLPIGLAERAAEIVIKERAEYAITSCTEDRIELYRQLLFEPTGEILYLPAFKDIPHYRMVQDVKKVRSMWSKNRVYSSIQKYLQDRGF
jgi:hypothetical protein